MSLQSCRRQGKLTGLLAFMGAEDEAMGSQNIGQLLHFHKGFELEYNPYFIK